MVQDAEKAGDESAAARINAKNGLDSGKFDPPTRAGSRLPSTRRFLG